MMRGIRQGEASVATLPQIAGTVLPRRRVLGGACAFLAAGSAAGQVLGRDGDLAALAEDAAIWGLPLVQTGRYLQLADSRGIRRNQFYLNQRLATPALKIPGPNVDTLYGVAWLDLSKGPVVLDVPDTHGRYYAIQLMDAYENSFAYVGRRTTGTGAGTYVIAAPGWRGTIPGGARTIDAPTSVVLALTRTLVRGEADLKAAQDVQSAFTLAPLSDYPDGRIAGIVQTDALSILPKPDHGGTGRAYFDELSRLVRLYPPRGEERRVFDRLAPLRLGDDVAQSPGLSAATLQTALERALAKVKQADVAEDSDGWRVNYGITSFIADPLRRAAVNQFGPGANVMAEALYFSASHDSDGAALDGSERYTITFAKGGLPPVAAFWSLILYGADFFLVKNPINRYSINDRSTGLVYGSDGSLRILIQHDRPANTANWLPAPAGGFQLILRTYQPTGSLLARTYTVPRIERVT